MAVSDPAAHVPCALASFESLRDEVAEIVQLGARCLVYSISSVMCSIFSVLYMAGGQEPALD